MKKVLIIIALIACIAAAGVWYLISGAGGIIKAQIEEQGSKYLDTKVTVFNVELVLSEGRMTITDLDVENPEGFSDEDAFSIETITLDLGTVTSEPYTVQTVTIKAPEMLYEMDASGKGNLILLKDNIQKSLPTSSSEPSTSDSASPLVIVENVTVSDLKLKLNFEKVDMGDLTPEQKTYEITLPTFNAGSIGKPNGIPADQVGLAIADAMLDNVIAKAKKEAKDALKDQAKDKLLEKASDKLKGLFN
ncbi:hypothetical protein [Paraglaciecola sp. 2405UD69-4]|uniref:hypothetical protein n=1 Tax=Paraglaciecola sp. 2405UD69-4 TaxID=3391836 RepID=UPI0039C9D388